MIKKTLFLLFFIYYSPNFSQEVYYNDLDLNLTGTTLKDALATKIINTHTKSLNYTPDIWNASKITDVNPYNSSQVLLIYGYTTSETTSRTRGINNNGGSIGNWNREHVFANSLAKPKLKATGTSGPPYADAHNLRPCDTKINSKRGNKKFASGSGKSSGFVSGGWYPGDEWKGDVARIIMYMYLRYGNQCKPTFVGVGSKSSTTDDMIDLFLQWNAEDPVSDIEKKRNNYQGNNNNTYAQGNRNPFIDNPRLATRIWGGPKAEDIWGIYTSTDTEAPSTPTNITLNNITTNSISISWTASIDNTAVTSYDIFVDGNLTKNVTTNNATIPNLNHNTTYVFTVLAKDAADNKSAKSTAVNGTTLTDAQAPTVPTNITISNQTDVSFKTTWLASTDNTATTGYYIYLNGNKIGTSSTVEYTVTRLTKSTTYKVQISAFDAANNTSELSASVNGTTTDGSTSNSNELFFSEYVEGGGNNKALEIANVTGNMIHLSNYSIQRQANGKGKWVSPLNLSGTLASGEVYVIINGQATIQKLKEEADLEVVNTYPNYGAPLNFNGNDAVGLFKKNVLIDVIGTFNNGGINFAKDVTLRRKSTVTSPNTTFDKNNEWNSFAKNTVNNIGVHNTSTANLTKKKLKTLNIYPNPIINNTFFIRNSLHITIKNISLFSIIGKKVFGTNKIKNTINFNKIKSGIYLLKIKSNLGNTIRKVIIK